MDSKAKPQFVHWALTGFTLLSALLSPFLMAGCSFPGPVFLTTTSPQGTYTVNFKGQKRRPVLLMVDNTVQFSVARKGQPFLSYRYFHSGDSLDPGFEDIYPHQNWLSEKVLHLYREQTRQERRQDMVFVSNNTDTEIRFLIVRSIEAIIMLEVEPRSTSKFPVSESGGDLQWISVEGEFTIGRKIGNSGVNFKSAGKPGPFTYQITVSESGVTIESPQLEKWKPASP